MPVKTGTQHGACHTPFKNSWIPGHASYRQLARNDDRNMKRNGEQDVRSH